MALTATAATVVYRKQVLGSGSNHFRMELMATPTTCRCCCRLVERSLRNVDEQLEKGVQVHVATLLSAAELHSTMKQIGPSLLPTSNGKAKHGTGRTERKPMSRWLDRSIQRWTRVLTRIDINETYGLYCQICLCKHYLSKRRSRDLAFL